MRHLYRRAASLRLFGLCCLLCCSGCGLLFVPTIETFPAPVQHISVRDARTGAAVSSVWVEVEMISVSTKAFLFDTTGTYPRDLEPKVESLAVKSEGQGLFAPQATTRVAFWQCLFPLFSWATPGNWWYYGHSNRILIEAPGYETFGIDYPAWVASNRMVGENFTFEKGLLSVRLKPAEAATPLVLMKLGHPASIAKCHAEAAPISSGVTPVIREMRNAGSSLQAIADKLNADGSRPCNGGRGTGCWSHSYARQDPTRLRPLAESVRHISRSTTRR